MGLTHNNKMKDDDHGLATLGHSIAANLTKNSSYLNKSRLMNKRLLRQHKIDQRRRRSFIDDVLTSILEEDDDTCNAEYEGTVAFTI